MAPSSETHARKSSGRGRRVKDRNEEKRRAHRAHVGSSSSSKWLNHLPEKSTHSINPVKHWWLEESSCGALRHYGQAAVHINTSPPTTARPNLQDALQLDQDLPLKFNALRTQEHDGSVLCMRRNLAIYGTAPPRYFCRYAQNAKPPTGAVTVIKGVQDRGRMGPVSEAPTIKRLLPRQTLSLTSSNTPHHRPTTSTLLSRKTTGNGVPSWAILTTVIGTLFILASCGFLFLWLRTRWQTKRGAMNSTALAFARGGQNGSNNLEGDGEAKENATTDKGSSAPTTSGNTMAEEGTKTRRRDSLLDQAEVRIRKLIKKTRPATSNSTSRLVHTTTNEDDHSLPTAFTTTSGGGASSTTRLRDPNPPPTALSYGGSSLDPNPTSNINNNDSNTNLFRHFSFKSPFSGGRPQTGSSGTSSHQPHLGPSPPVSSPSNHPLSSEGHGGVEYYNSAYYNSIARPSEDDWRWADDSIAHTIRGSYDNQDHERDLEDNATTTHAGTTLYHGQGGATSTEGAMSDESRSGGVRTLFSGTRRETSKNGGRDDNFDVIPLETRTSPPSGFWNASRTNNSRWVTR
ncbi:hypothetical protein CPB86DRAFT_793276 [Serendipita vermifera]|nr:hypothetical protein CPB86DRAFT_793276 [Serendipita vermifera]